MRRAGPTCRLRPDLRQLAAAGKWVRHSTIATVGPQNRAAPSTHVRAVGTASGHLRVRLRACGANTILNAAGARGDTGTCIGSLRTTTRAGREAGPTMLGRGSSLAARSAHSASPRRVRSPRGMAGSSGGCMRSPSRSICAMRASTASRPSGSATASSGVRLPSAGSFSLIHRS